jgi:hypothetical protein
MKIAGDGELFYNRVREGLPTNRRVTSRFRSCER